MPGTNLTRAEAIERSSVVTAQQYDVKLDLTQGEQTFRSETTVQFTATAGAASFIDLISDNVHSIELNGKSIPVSAHVDSRISLENLQAENTLTVVADCNYMHTGEGMHRFVDPTDNEAYVYTQFEVPDARRVFTVFEQPDQKATYQFTVTVPKHWVVLSNAPTPTPTVDEAAGKAVFAFAPSPKISSYITAIVAGPYKSAHSTVKSIDGRVLDTGVYARASMMKHMDADNVFKLTQKGFEFFEKMYGEPYPFPKYDHIFVPEYNAGAMENAGCITYTEHYVFTSTPTEDIFEARANTILHELAHMWFGDLITMKWWNDLWLNESFAEFMSHLALAEGTEFKDAWVGFGSRKLWGMRADQMPTTHPIVAPIKDLHDVEVNFDGITYAKGACVLRQLVAYLGREAFEQGLQSYFKKYKWGNTELHDLLNEFAAASGKDLDAWAKVWLEEAGITQLRTELVAAGDQIEHLYVDQELVMQDTSLRPQSTMIAGLKLKGKQYETLWELPVQIEGARVEVKEAAGKEVPDAVILNSSDDAYAKIRFDQDTLAHVITRIPAIPDATMRLVVVMALWDMCRDGELAAADYLDMLLATLPREQQANIAQVLLSTLTTTVTSYTKPAERSAAAARASEVLVTMIKELPAGSSLQQQAAQALVVIASEQHLELLEDFVNNQTINGLELGDKLRWSALISLAAAGRNVADGLALMREQDPSLAGAEYATAVAGMQDLPATWESLLTDEQLSNGKVQVLLRSWRSQAWRQTDRVAEVSAEYWQRLLPTWNERTFHIAELLLQGLFPDSVAGVEVGYDVEAKTNAWLEANQDQPDALKRLVTEGLDGYLRILKAQQA